MLGLLFLSFLIFGVNIEFLFLYTKKNLLGLNKVTPLVCKQKRLIFAKTKIIFVMKKTITLFVAALAFVATGCAKKAAPAEVAVEPVKTEVAEAAEAAPSVVKTIDASLSGDQIMPAIKKNYEGKVVVLDFWATWCPPCRAAMKTVDEIKPGLQEKGVVFVYVTGETSPLDKWNEMIPNISGDHYRLTNKQWGELCRLLNVPGIPAYMILNKDGSTAYDNLSQGGYPGNDVILNNAEVALTK